MLSILDAALRSNNYSEIKNSTEVNQSNPNKNNNGMGTEKVEKEILFTKNYLINIESEKEKNT